MRSIFEQIRSDRDNFLHNEIEVVDGLTFSQYNTIKKIHKYYNGHYDKGDYETINGLTRKKVFFNINKWRCEVATKMIDVDVKDFVLYSEDPASDLNVYLLEKELKAWLKKHKLGKVLNEVVRKLPVYGSVVLRKVKGGAEMVDLRNLINDQSASKLTDGNVIIRHFVTAGELRKKKNVWDNVSDVLEHHLTTRDKGYEDKNDYRKGVSAPYAEVYEFFGEVPVKWLKNEATENYETDYTMARFIVSGLDRCERNSDGQVTLENGIILFKEEIDEVPFKEVHYTRSEGRWLGIGAVEDTFEDQRRINEIKDQEAKAMELSSLMLFQTRDQIVQRNLLADVINGDILKVQSELTRVDNTNRAQVEFKQASDAYETHADRSTFSYDVVRGEASPASSTATAVMNQTQQAFSVFDYKRENIGLFLNEFVTDLVFPEMEKEINMPHAFRFTGSVDEMERMRAKAIEGYIRTLIFEGTIPVPSKEEAEALKAQMLQEYRKEGEKMWIKTVRDFFKNHVYHVTLEISGESKNVQSQLQNLGQLLSQVTPEMLMNSFFRRLLYKYMSMMGIQPLEFELLEQDMQQQQLTEQNAQPAGQGQPVRYNQPA